MYKSGQKSTWITTKKGFTTQLKTENINAEVQLDS